MDIFIQECEIMQISELIYYADIIMLGIVGSIVVISIILFLLISFFYANRVRLINAYNFIRRRNYLAKIENEIDLHIREKYFYKLNNLYDGKTVFLHCYMDVLSGWTLTNGEFSFKDKEGYTYDSNMKNFAYAVYADHNYCHNAIKEDLVIEENNKIHKELLAKRKQEKEAKLKEYLLKYDAMNDIMCELSKEFDKE